MHRIGVVGISWRHGTADSIASFTIGKESRAERVPRLAAVIGVPELVYLATCNRVEVVFTSDGHTPLPVLRRRIFAELPGREPRAGEAEHTLRAWQGEGAAEHLFLVAAGLESARVGESEIVGQVREAVEGSRQLALLGPHLDALFTEALRVAKKVRPVTEGRIGRVSLAQVAVRYARERLDRTPGRVALVGVSPMTEQCARELTAAGTGVVIVNRTLERAQSLANEVHGDARSLTAFRESPDAIEVVIVATGAKEPVFSRADLERIAARTPSAQSPLIIDLAIPPNVTPEDAIAADVPRIGMDEITLSAAEDRERVIGEFADAREIVDASLTELRRQMAERLIGPMIADLHRRFRHTAIEGVERLFKQELAALGEPERDAVRRWAETLARRFAHVPSVGLRDLVFQAGPAAVEAFLSHTEPELAQQLHAAAGESGVAMLIEQELEEA
jgi:glutamyl-tRNA reductase